MLWRPPPSSDQIRPLLSGRSILYHRGGGGGQRPKKVCVPKIDPRVRAPLTNFIFSRKKHFLMWVGGWVGQPKTPEGGGGGGGAIEPPARPPPPSITKQGPGLDPGQHLVDAAAAASALTVCPSACTGLLSGAAPATCTPPPPALCERLINEAHSSGGTMQPR